MSNLPCRYKLPKIAGLNKLLEGLPIVWPSTIWPDIRTGNIQDLEALGDLLWGLARERTHFAFSYKGNVYVLTSGDLPTKSYRLYYDIHDDGEFGLNMAPHSGFLYGRIKQSPDRQELEDFIEQRSL